MAKKKVCKRCKVFVEGDECPLCHGSMFSTSYQGRINVLNVNKSAIAKKMGIEVADEYAIKVR